MSSTGAVILSYGDSLIRESDMKRLRCKAAWLNDKLIGFYFEYLATEIFREDLINIKFVDPGVAQWIKLCDSMDESMIENLKGAEFIFFPINDADDPEVLESGSHWSLLLFSKTTKLFAHFDSSPGYNETQAKFMAKKLNSILSDTGDASINYKEFPCESQSNAHDCGLHVLANADKIAGTIKDRQSNSDLFSQDISTASPLDAEKMRDVLSQLIERIKLAQG